MELRPLGRSGIAIPPFVLGGNVFGWTADLATSFAVLDAYVAHGFTAIDTAEVYSRWVPGHQGGESETIIGSWLSARGGRDQLIIASKVGMDMGSGRTGLGRARIMQAVEGSLRRLQTDYIDLYQSHIDDPTTPIDETLAAYEELLRAGKIRAIGASQYQPDRLSEALDIANRMSLPMYATLQPLYNLLERRGFENGLAQVAASHGLAVIPFYGLASGFLTGKYRSPADLAGRARAARVADYLDARGLALLGLLDTLAVELAATPAQISLAWLMRKVTAPIASATSVSQLEELLGAVRLELPDAVVARLDAQTC